MYGFQNGSKNGIKSVLGRMMVVMSAVAAVAAVAPNAQAVPLVPGGVVVPAGTTAAARPELAGVVIADTIRPFAVMAPTGAVIAKGFVQDRVVRSYRTQTLHFYTRVYNSDASRVKVQSVVRMDFGGWALDTDYRLDGLGTIAPNWIVRSVGPGTNVRIGLPVLPSTSSRFVFLATRAFYYELGHIALVLSNGQVIWMPGYQPA